MQSAPAPQFNAQQATQQQSNSNISTAAANSYLNAINQYTPTGNLIWKQVGERQMGDGSVKIPEWQVTQELSPEQQKILSQTQGLQNRALGTAGNVLDQVNKTVNTPLDFNGLAQLPQDQAAFRDQAYEALTARGRSEIDRAQEASRTALKNQGVVEGSEAWRRGMEEYGQARNDLSNQSFLRAGDLAGQNLNQAQTLRNQGIQERMTLRNQPLLDYQSLLGLSGGITSPQFQNTGQVPVANTDAITPAMQSYQGQLQSWQAGQGANNALMGGLFGLGGAIGGGLARNFPLGKMFGIG